MEVEASQRYPYRDEEQENTDGDENVERGNWTGRFDFFLSCLGYAVGLGNVWRFPYLCYKNGGGVFFIPYTIFLFLVGIPIFLIELSLGQFSSEGTLTCWRYSPIFQGLGVGMFVVSALVAIYYNVIITWAIWYLFASFRAVLPWTTCDPEWASPFCSGRLKNITKEVCNQTIGLFAAANGVCYNTTNGSKIVFGIFDDAIAKNNNIKAVMPANDYLNHVGLQVKRSDGFQNLGIPRWDMTLCLLLSWIIVFLCMVRGIKSSGKVVYFTALFPYFVLVVLFIRGLMLEGSGEGIRFYIVPKPEKLLDATVWKDAAVQIFYSLSVSWGGLMSLSSYNKFHTDVVTNTLTVSIGNCLTSVFAGFVIFSYLGAFAKSAGVSVDNVVDSGVALAFIVYPQAMTTLPISTLWSILFFLMLITLGLDSEFATMETLVTGIVDFYPRTRKYKTLMLGLSCAAFFLLGLSMVTPGGPYMVTLFDDYCGSWSIMVIALLECISITYVYGARRFANDIEVMIGRNAIGCVPWKYFKWPWIICWGFLSPLFLIAIIVFSFVNYEGSVYGDYVFPGWVNTIGLLMTILCIVAIVGTACIQILREKGSFLERIRKLLRPDPLWGPYLVRHRRLITYVENFEIDPRGLENLSMDYDKAETNPGYVGSVNSVTEF